MENRLQKEYTRVADLLGEIDLSEDVGVGVAVGEEMEIVEQIAERIGQARTLAGKISILVDLTLNYALTGAQLRSVILSAEAQFIEHLREEFRQNPCLRSYQEYGTPVIGPGFRFSSRLLALGLGISSYEQKYTAWRFSFGSEEMPDSFATSGINSAFYQAFLRREKQYEERIKGAASLAERLILFSEMYFGYFYGLTLHETDQEGGYFMPVEDEMDLLLGGEIDWAQVRLSDFVELQRLSSPDGARRRQPGDEDVFGRNGWKKALDVLADSPILESLLEELRNRFPEFVAAEKMEQD